MIELKMSKVVLTSVVVFVASLSVVADVATSKRVVGLRHRMNSTEKDALKSFVNEIVAETSQHLKMPAILEPSTSPAKFLKEQYTNPARQVSLRLTSLTENVE